MFKNEGGGVKGRLNNVKKNRQFGTGERPLGLPACFKTFDKKLDNLHQDQSRNVSHPQVCRRGLCSKSSMPQYGQQTSTSK